MARWIERMANSLSPLALPVIIDCGGCGNSIAKFNLVSYNLGGLDGQGRVLLSELCSEKFKLGVILLQEHWLSPDRLTLLQNFDPSFSSFGMSGMEEKLSMGILKGRPFGGAAILVHNSLLASTAYLLITERVNIISVCNTIVINAYFSSKEVSNRPITLSLLREIGLVIEMFPGYDVLMGGDFNMDLREKSPLTNPVHDFIKKCNLKICYDLIKPNCDYTFFRDALGQKTMIDFFLCSDSLKSRLVEHEMLDKLLNYSDHLPLFVSVNAVMNPVPSGRVSPPSPPRKYYSSRKENFVGILLTLI